MRLLVLFALGFAATSTALSQDAVPAKKAAVTYKDDIAPILRKRCGSCHNADEAKSDLNLLTYQTLLSGGSGGEAIAPGSAAQSRLYRLVTHQEEPSMPPRQPKLPDAELDMIANWIDNGAPETAVSAVMLSTRKTEIDYDAIVSVKPDGDAAFPVALPKIEAPSTLRGTAVTALDASPWAPVLAVSGHECVQLHDSNNLQLLGALPFPEGIIHVLKFSRNGERLLAAGGRGAERGIAVLFDVRSGERLAEIGDEEDSVLAADLSPDQSMVAIGGPNKLIKVYSTSSGELAYQIKKHTDWITAIEFSPDGKYLASGDRNGGAFVWEAETGGIVFTLGDHKEMITEVNWRADSQMLASASEDGRVILWYAEDGFPARSVNAHASVNASTPNPRQKLPGVLSVRFTKTGDFASVGRDASAMIWGNLGSRNIAKFEGFASQIPTRVCLNHDGHFVIVGDSSGMLRAWNLKSKTLVSEVSTQLK